MDYETILFKKEGGSGIITFNRPNKLNALNSKVTEELGRVINDCAQDPEVKVVIFTGGPDLFGAGADIGMLESIPSSADCYVFSVESSSVYNAIENIGKPTIAAIGGFCLGGMMEISLCCDFRIAADNARFGLPEVTLGILPGGGGTQRLPRLVGMTKAKELAYLGELIDAQEGYRIGLLNKVVPKDQLLKEAEKLARKLMERPLFAVRMIKSAMNTGANMGLREALEIERQSFTILFSTEDKSEGLKAFLEKRKGQFKGK